MNYDEHQTDSEPGPIASQDWFLDNLKAVLKIVPKEKIICSLGSYGYDWTTTLPPSLRGREGEGGKPAPEKVLSAHNAVDAGGLAGGSGLRLTDRSRRRLAERPLRLRRRRRARPPPGLVSRCRHDSERDARRADAGHSDLRALAAGLGRQLDVEDLGPSAARRTR